LTTNVANAPRRRALAGAVSEGPPRRCKSAPAQGHDDANADYGRVAQKWNLVVRK